MLEKEDVAEARQTVVGKNGLTSNGLTSNGLTSNGLSAVGIDLSPLSKTGLEGNSQVADKIAEAYSPEILQYIASCALPLNANFTAVLNGVSVQLQGQLGLAPTWGDENGTCDAACKTWVSGCILARLNYYGNHVEISLRGNTSALATTPTERGTYETAEATYFGDLFSDPSVVGTKRFACKIAGSTLIERVCGPQDDGGGWSNCVVSIGHDCNDADVCGDPDATDGYFSNCKDSNHNAYTGSVTVYRDIN